MVFGPVLDAIAARREGKSSLAVVSRGHHLVNTQLPWKLKLCFWLTNLPYHALAFCVAFGPAPKLAGPRWAHIVATSIVAATSTAFHGAVLFGDSNSRWPNRLLSADLLTANGYGVVLAALCGVQRVVTIFGLPLLLLFSAARRKRAGDVVSYAYLHGIWHVLSAAAIWRCAYSE